MISATPSSLADIPTSDGGVNGWAIGVPITVAVLVTAIICVCVVLHYKNANKGKLHLQEAHACM